MKKMIKVLGLAFLALIGICWPVLAFAQDADPVAAVQGLDDALAQGGKTAAWLMALIFGVAALRKWGVKLWPSLGKGTLAVALACVAGALSAVVEPVVAGAGLVAIVMAAGQGLLAGLAAAGVVRGAQMVGKPAAPPAE